MNGENVACHCPPTGRIGYIELVGRPCLLSKAANSSRKTPYTVEAVSLNHPDEIRKSWIGINQNAANRYVEHYLANGGFAEMTDETAIVHREQFLVISKLDFPVGNTYLEVKTPLQSLQINIPDYIKRRKSAPLMARFLYFPASSSAPVSFTMQKMNRATTPSRTIINIAVVISSIFNAAPPFRLVSPGARGQAPARRR